MTAAPQERVETAHGVVIVEPQDDASWFTARFADRAGSLGFVCVPGRSKDEAVAHLCSIAAMSA